MRALWAGLVFLAFGGDPPDPNVRAAATHTDERRTEHVLVRWVPGSIPDERALAEAARSETALQEVEAALEQKLGLLPTHFLYRDAADLAASTGMPETWAAFVRGDRTVHATLGAPLRHEWTHVVAQRIPGAAADPGPVIREGLAAAIEGTDRGIAVEDWASVERRLGLLPSLGLLRQSFPQGPPEFGPPDHATGGFVKFLLATRGLKKLKALLVKPGDPAGTLGAAWEELDAEFHRWLDERAVPEAAEIDVRSWYGLPVRRRTPAPGAKTANLLEGEKPLDRFSSRRPGTWRVDGGALVGTAAEEWFAALDSTGSFPAGTGLRAVIVPGPGATAYLRVGRRDVSSDEALLGPGGAFLTLGGGERGLARVPRIRLAPGRRVEAVLDVRNTRARLFLDGWLVHEHMDAATGGESGEGGVGIGVRGGELRVEALEALLPAQ